MSLLLHQIILSWLPFPSFHFTSQFLRLFDAVMLIVWCNDLVAFACKCLVRPWGLIVRNIDVKILEQCLFGLRMKLVIVRRTVHVRRDCGCLYKGLRSSECRAAQTYGLVWFWFLWFLLMLQGCWTHLNVGSVHSPEEWFAETWIRATPVVFPEPLSSACLEKCSDAWSPVRLVSCCQ